VSSRDSTETGDWRLVALIALIGIQLRSVIIGVSPVVPELRIDLHLSFSAAGALTAIPVLGLGVAAIPGAILVNRFGARRVIGAATLGLGFAALLRLTPPLPYSLFLWTTLLSLSAATAQPALSAFIRNWFPGQIQRVSTVYAMALSAGGLAGAVLSVYLLAFGGWRGTFAIWASAAIVSGVVWIWLAPGRGSLHAPVPHGLGALVRDFRVWHTAALFGAQSLVYNGANSWIPFVLRGYSHDYLALVLFLFQVVSVPLIGILAIVNLPWALSRVWYMTGGLSMVVGSAALMFGLTGLAWVWAPLIGLGSAMVFAGTTTLPAIMAKNPSDVAGYSALTLTAGYALAFLGPLLGGILLDQTHLITSPFWVITVAAAAAIGLGGSLPRPVSRLPNLLTYE
jgi:CP family cyanate transporter-like MFS transporter